MNNPANESEQRCPLISSIVSYRTVKMINIKILHERENKSGKTLFLFFPNICDTFEGISKAVSV